MQNMQNVQNRVGLRVLLTIVAAVFGGIGVVAIAFETHTGFARRQGLVTLEGEDAVRFGWFMVCLALLPLVVWLPRRLLGAALAAWWLLLMVVLSKVVLQLF